MILPDAAVLRSVKVAKGGDSAKAAYGDIALTSNMPTQRKTGSIDAVASSNLGDQVAHVDAVLNMSQKEATPIK